MVLFRMKTPPLIRDLEEVKQKIQLLEALSDIEAAIRTLEAGDEQLAKLHPVDRHYDAMKCQLQQLDHESEVFKVSFNFSISIGRGHTTIIEPIHFLTCLFYYILFVADVEQIPDGYARCYASLVYDGATRRF